MRHRHQAGLQCLTAYLYQTISGDRNGSRRAGIKDDLSLCAKTTRSPVTSSWQKQATSWGGAIHPAFLESHPAMPDLAEARQKQ